MHLQRQYSYSYTSAKEQATGVLRHSYSTVLQCFGYPKSTTMSAVGIKGIFFRFLNIARRSKPDLEMSAVGIKGIFFRFLNIARRSKPDLESHNVVVSACEKRTPHLGIIHSTVDCKSKKRQDSEKAIRTGHDKTRQREGDQRVQEGKR